MNIIEFNFYKNDIRGGWASGISKNNFIHIITLYLEDNNIGDDVLVLNLFT